MNKMKYTETMGLKSVDEEKQIIEMVCSKEAIDRDNEVVVTDGIDLSEIKKGGSLFFSHEQRSLPIGKLLNVWKSGKELKAKAQFVSVKANPLAPLVYESIKEGSLHSVSIGFMPDFSAMEFKKVKGKNVTYINKSELLEISIVGVPAGRGTSITVKEFKAVAEGLWEKGIFDGQQLNTMTEAIDAVGPEKMNYEQEIKTLKAEMEELRDGRLITQLFDNYKKEVKTEEQSKKDFYNKCIRILEG